ncbi:ABC transporter permease [Aureimonas flava]|uniref:ABC transporter permease n=1 Tax=Aureimonas flava TaxID=2320271 RepID=A0A3A1WNA7_9HYPH|nr:ABC transporter permease [Aureimonas flava]RIY02007.1 ABC transporter permease [Aureimonas flava]
MILLDALNWIAENQSTFFGAFRQHLVMCATSLAIGSAVAIPLGFAVAHSPRAAFAAVNLVGAFRAIPSLAILAAMLPILGIGFLPSVVALVVLAIPPMLLNTIAGVRGIDPAIIDAASGIGMGRRERLLQVELPLAVPPIVAGLKTASIQLIGGAALASFIGGGGLGDFINTGIAIMDMARLLVGAVPIALLAIATELLLSGVERLVKRQG